MVLKTLWKKFVYGKPEEIAYRLSHVFQIRRPFPLLQLITKYSNDRIPPIPTNEDPYFFWRELLHEQITIQLQNLGLLEAYYKYNDRIPDETPEGLKHPKFILDIGPSQIRGSGKGLYIKAYDNNDPTCFYYENDSIRDNTVNEYKSTLIKSDNSDKIIAKRGQIICLYPGLSYFNVHQGYIDQHGLNLRFPRGSRDYILTLESSIWIDGNPRSGIVNNAMKHQIWARGHYINHPTFQFEPNILPVLYDFGPDFVENGSTKYKQFLRDKKINLEKFVCTEFGWEFAKAESEYLPTGVFIALRDIKNNEELFFDYEWEYNINHIYYAFEHDIHIDWPWYQTVEQSKIDKLIQPFMTQEKFVEQLNNDQRLKLVDKNTDGNNYKIIKSTIKPTYNIKSSNIKDKTKSKGITS